MRLLVTGGAGFIGSHFIRHMLREHPRCPGLRGDQRPGDASPLRGGTTLAGGAFLQVGTDEVYGSVEDGCFTEEDPLGPNSPYAANKAAADLLCLAYTKTYGLPVITTRRLSANEYLEREIQQFFDQHPIMHIRHVQFLTIAIIPKTAAWHTTNTDIDREMEKSVLVFFEEDAQQ